MPMIRRYIVTQTREVEVSVVPEANESYATAALRIAEAAFENPGQPAEGMRVGVRGLPMIVSTNVERKR